MQHQLRQLMTKNQQLQSKLAELQYQITTANTLNNYQSGLTDNQGYPRNDINFGEIAQYRNLKKMKAELNNDHFALMKQIQYYLGELHSTYPDVQPSVEQVGIKQTAIQEELSSLEEKIQTEGKYDKQQQSKQHTIDYLTPFAKVSLVEQESPSFKAGLRVGDLLSQYDEVNIYTIGGIKQIPKCTKQGRQINVVVLRMQMDDTVKGDDIFQLKDQKKYRKITLRLVPMVWGGKGLLGCKIDPIH